MILPKTYTPEDVAEILQLSKNTIYNLINRGEIVAKKIGKVYRIPQSSISFVFTGMDQDIYEAQLEDEKNLKTAGGAIDNVRKEIWQKSASF